MKKLTIALLLFVFMIVDVDAQKLPNVQTVAVLAPANIKVDGKVNEWEGKMQAYNKATGIFYTIANDDINLYLVVQATNQDIIHKIVKGGLVLSINPSGKSLNKGAVAVTYPAYGDKMASLTLMMNNKPEPLSDPEKNKVRLDSFYNAKNLIIAQYFKLIKQTGMKAFPDSLMSVYNDDGIKAAAYLGHNDVYSYELAIPLKYLNIDLTNPAKFYYNLKLNGTAYYAVKVVEVREGIFSMLGADGRYYGYGADQTGNSLMFPTDFWGEYTLAKKL